MAAKHIVGGWKIAVTRGGQKHVGTLGCIVIYTGTNEVKDELVKGRIYGLTVQHVVGEVGTWVYQAEDDNSSYVGKVQKAIYREENGLVRMDAAIFDLHYYGDDKDPLPFIREIGDVRGWYEVKNTDIPPLALPITWYTR